MGDNLSIYRYRFKKMKFIGIAQSFSKLSIIVIAAVQKDSSCPSLASGYSTIYSSGELLLWLSKRLSNYQVWT